jgi:hypothetical protein
MTAYRYYVNDPDIYDGYTDEEKWLAMTDGITPIEADSIGDGSHLVATGPFTLLPDGAVTVAFAIIGATSEADMFASAQHARAQYAAGVVSIVPTSLSFTAVEGGANPASKSVTLTNNTSLDAGFSVINTALMSWMSVSPSSGSIPSGGSSTLDVSAELGELAEGSYPDSIVIEVGSEEPELLRVSTALTVTSASEVLINPNPFSPLKGDGIVTMRVTSGDGVKVKASVYDIAGEKVKDLPEAASGGHITWDGKTDDGDIVANGVYFCRIVGINVPFARTYTIVLKK